jgi:cation transport regulator
MPTYKTNNELPETVKDNLPEHGQDIYREAFNSAWEQYDEPHERKDDRTREETAHAVAWNAVKMKYKKNEEGEWVHEDDN